MFDVMMTTVFLKSFVRPLPSVRRPSSSSCSSNVQDFWMRLLDFVEQNHGVGTAPHCFGQLAGLFVSDISWRRAEETHTPVCFSWYSDSVYANHCMLVVE